MTWSYESLGWLAALSVVLQACSTSMLPLRIFAVCSNALFITYAHFSDIVPMLALHALLLPINLVQLTLLVAGGAPRRLPAIWPSIAKRDSASTPVHPATNNTTKTNISSPQASFRRFSTRKEPLA
jgi:hypothetical protein